MEVRHVRGSICSAFSPHHPATGRGYAGEPPGLGPDADHPGRAMLGGMRRVLVPTAVFAVLVFVGYALLSDASLMDALVKALVVGAIFALVQGWLVWRRVRRDGTPTP